jgi:hypothetical protein
LKWPGQAAVVVSVVHVANGDVRGPYLLDAHEVLVITAYLFHAGGHEDPKRLRSNEGKSFQGPIPLGMGFTFDDNDRKGIATPVSEMVRLINKEPRNQECIFPYIAGEELNESPTHATNRYVINFGEVSEEVAKSYPDLYAIVSAKVKPERMAQRDNPDGRRRKQFWWRWGRHTPALDAAKVSLQRVLVHSWVAQHLEFAFVPAAYIVSGPHNVFLFAGLEPFSVLQSRVHEIWVRFFGATLEDRIVYARSDCFETFPFPPRFDSNVSLDEIGRTYYERRAEIMQTRNKGLTATYNEFHNPDSDWPEIVDLRELHDAMDRAVLDAYGWTDVQACCDFIPEFDDEDDEDENGHPRRKKYRYRWPDEVRDDVLARLLELNRQRALEEGRMPTEPPVFAGSDPEPQKNGSRKKRGKRSGEDLNLSLLPQGKEEA